MLISKTRERDFVGNKVPENMVAAEERLDLLSDATIRDAVILHVDFSDWVITILLRRM